MKKLLSVIIVFVAAMMINLPISHAKQVRFADVGAENFVAQLKQILYSDDFQKSVTGWENYTVRHPILTDVFRDRNFDIPNEGLTAWSCYYGREDSVKKDGQIVFFTDGSGYVFEILMISRRESSSAQVTTAIITAFFVAMNLTNDESGTLMKNGYVWSSYNNRMYETAAQYNEHNTVMSFVAFDS